MPTQPPHHVSSLALRISDLSRISSVRFRISQSLSRRAGNPSGRIMRNEPNLPHAHRPADPKKRNEPNSPKPTPNRQPPKKRNKPNVSRGGPVEDEKIRNEPNLHPATISPRWPQVSQSLSKFIPARRGSIGDSSGNPIHHTARLLPHRRTPQKHETNPIQTERP